MKLGLHYWNYSTPPESATSTVPSHRKDRWRAPRRVSYQTA